MSEIETRPQNKIRALFTLSKYSLLTMFRNPATVFFGFFFPFIFISVFGLIGNDVTFDVAVRDGSSEDNPIIQSLERIETVDLERELTEEEIADELEKGQIAAAIYVEVNQQGRILVDIDYSAAEPNGSSIVQSIVGGIADEINFAPFEDEPKTVIIEEEEVEGREFTQIDFILPGQLGFALLANGVFGIAFTFITLRQTLVIKRLFATPIDKLSIILAEVFAKLVYALIQAAVIIGVGVILFDYTLINGPLTFALMLVLSAIALIVFLGFGFLVAGIAKDENTAPAVANLINLPQFLLSGAFFPIDSFPEFLQPIAEILPLTYLNDALRSVAFEGESLTTVLPEMAGLFVWGIIVYIIAIRLFKWE